MFKSDKKKVIFGKVETLIGHTTQIEGIIEIAGTIRIDGTIKGGIRQADGVIIGDTGIIEGDIHAKGVSLGGKVKGNIFSEISLELLPDSILIGNVETGRLTIAEGAHFDGVCSMLESGENKKKSSKIEKKQPIAESEESI